MVTAGGNNAFIATVLALGDPGDEFILPVPYYFNHEMAITMANCRPVLVPTDANYQLDLAALRAAITPRTRAIITVSPNNPTGAVYPAAALRAVNQLCAERGIFHLSDEAYESFVYDGAEHFSAASLDGSAPHTISLYSLSKAYGFASWRIGWMVFPEKLEAAMRKIQDTLLYPQHPMHASSVEEVLGSAQQEFWALDLGPPRGAGAPAPSLRETRYGLSVAEADGTLQALGSTYSAENGAVYDGLSRSGSRLVTFAPILKHGVFPLAEILSHLLEVGSRGMNRPAEIEFAVRLSHDPAEPHQFGFLQMRPLVLQRETAELDVDQIPSEALLCRSTSVLGNGLIDTLRDLVVVDFHRFERSDSAAAAAAVGRFNAELTARERPYLLIGVGRWGSRDPWLGIPVSWDQIAGARVIVEAGFRDFRVTPSQGSHFFQNLTSFQIGYFTVNADGDEGFVDWPWIASQRARKRLGPVRHLEFEQPLVVKMNGRRNQGVIYKPGGVEAATR